MMKPKDNAGLDSFSGGSDADTWKPLRLFNLYRMLLATLLLVLYETGPHPAILGQHDGALYEVVSATYLIFSIASSLTARWRIFPFVVQVNTQVLTDIIILTLLMYTSGGLTSGLGILIVVSIAGGSIMMAGRMAILYAAVGALAILFAQVYAHLNSSFETTAYTRAGILGTTFFATALLAHVLASRVRESEKLAAQRGIDLANMERLNERIILNMKTGIMVVDHDTRIRLLNDAARSLLHLGAVEHHAPLHTVCPQLEQQLRSWRQDPTQVQAPFQPVADAAAIMPNFTPLGSDTRAGTLIYLEDHANFARQLQQLKLASLGRLTASIAHEIRNPLGAISHAAQLLQESPALDKGDLRLTEIIQDHSQRMNAIVENILQLSRRDQSHPKQIPLQQWLGAFVEEFTLMEHLQPGQIEVRMESPEITIQFDPNHLQQILWNLCQNAVKYGTRTGAQPHVVLHAGVDDSGQRFLEVMDNGPGIDEKSAQEIFEPFFTTHTEGTGLGLYICRELCECNRAQLHYRPGPSSGSCFRISFS